MPKVTPTLVSVPGPEGAASDLQGLDKAPGLVS
jgi:hypothetical protein